MPQKQQLIRWLVRDKYRGVAPVETVLDQDLARLAAGEPLAYVIGWVDFLGCKIDLSHKTLIPRPETEYWVGQVQQELVAKLAGNAPHQQQLRLLDLGCGSGCIGISFLEKFPQLTVDFADLASNAIAQTELNLKLNQLAENRARVLQGHLFDNCSGKYDVIVSNPPYVDPSGEVGEETRYEPQQAIFAQKGGLSLIEEIIVNSKKYLKSGGKLILEFGQGQAPAIETLAKTAEFSTINVRKDQYGVCRFVELS